MKQLYIKQKVLSLSEKFTIKNEQDNDVYYVEGSFMKIPKTFHVINTMKDEIALIIRKLGIRQAFVANALVALMQ